MTLSHLGPCRKEVLGGIKPPHFCLLAFTSCHTSLNFLRGPFGRPEPGLVWFRYV